MTAAAPVAARVALHAQIEARAVALGYDAAEVARIAPWDWGGRGGGRRHDRRTKAALNLRNHPKI